MPYFTLSSLTCHRFVIASITASSKGLCDAFCTNSLYAKVGGISITELNILEREFLAAIDWRLTVSSIRRMDHYILTIQITLPLPCQCTREILQEYYINLVRTNTSGQFFIVTSDSSTSSQSDGDIQMASRPASPSENTPATRVRHRSRSALLETSTVLGDSTTVTQDLVPRRPTVEQNMAFAALRESQESGDTRGGQLQ
jgi:hypothetical protein